MLKKIQNIQEKMRKRLPGTWIHQTLGERLFHGHLWVHDQRAVAGGLAIGLFVAFTPTIPLQMFLAAVGAIYFRVNIPIALAACWVTNPLTAGPIYLASWKIGRYILENVMVTENVFGFFGQGRMHSVVKQSAYLWTGSLVFASLAAMLAYWVTVLFWTKATQWYKQRKD